MTKKRTLLFLTLFFFRVAHGADSLASEVWIDIWVEHFTGMQFVPVKGGCYQMGCDPEQMRCANDEQPRHEVCVGDFWMGRHEVTQGQWRMVMDENPSRFAFGNDYPVEGVTWDDAQIFVGFLSQISNKKFSLPTEAEWEYAARSGGKDEIYSGSDSLDSVAWFWRNSKRTTHPVGTKQPNGLGIHDMSGNVWEWCEDFYEQDFYPQSPKLNPKGPRKGTAHVYRGGDWFHLEQEMRTVNRRWTARLGHPDDKGLRLIWREE